MKNTIKIKLPKIDQVEFDIHCMEESTPIKGNVMASGDDKEDAAAEQWVIDQLYSGNSWAWCTVKVTANYRGLEGSDYLGCCSYRSTPDFMNDAYFNDMKQTAYNDLIQQIKNLAK